MLQRHRLAGGAEPPPPGLRDPGLDRHPRGDRRGQHGLDVRGVLLEEPLHARHGDDAGGHTLGLEGLRGLDGQLDLGTGGQGMTSGVSLEPSTRT